MADYAWQVRPLGSMLRRRPRYGINAPASASGSGGRPYIRITDIDDDGRFRPSPRVEVRHADSASYLLRPGDVVFARTGASVGKSYRYDPADGQLVFAGFLINITPDPSILNPGYLAAYVQTAAYRNWVAATSVRSGQPGINGREYALMPLPVPPIEVQNSISEAMADCDAEANTIECLIDKKHAIKQGMAQQLISGKTRLPSFEQEWADSTISSLARVTGGGTPSTRVPTYWNGRIPWFTPAEIDVEGSGLVSISGRTITPDGLANSSATLLPAGSVLVTSRASIGNCAVAKVAVTTNQGFASMIPKDPRSTWFLYYWTQQNKSELQSRAAGSTFLEISASKVAALPLQQPSLDEQQAIGEALRDADLELDVLRRRLDKAKAIKQGMAQQLLSDKTRLPVLETAA